MKKQYRNLKEHFEILIGHAHNLHNKRLEDIQSMFSGYEYCVVEYCGKTEISKIMEIELPDTHLTCSFSDNGLCNYCSYSFDTLLNIQEYVKYCNDKYTYNYLYQVWELSKHSLKLRVKGNKAIFSLIPYES